MKEKTILFSGRFQPPHCGHIASIVRLGQRYDKVLVVILSTEGQEYPVGYRAQIMQEILNSCTGDYDVLINTEHFAEITKQQIADRGYKFDVYGSGNLKCLKHMESLGYQIEYVDRAYEYEATNYRQMAQIKEMLHGK